jgi:prepilin-type N-terminal cleavage/methylation domain-containing protein
MCATKKTANRRGAFTLVELLVVILIMLVIAALAAAFVPRVSDSQNLTRAVDQLEQWLLTAKMRAKRDQLATGVRFVQTPGDAAGTFSQLQYIQQPDPLSGGWFSSTQTPGSVPAGNGLFLTGGLLREPNFGVVQFANVDFTLGGTPQTNQWLVQPGDFLEVRDAGVYSILKVLSPTSLQLGTSTYDTTFHIPSPGTTNYRILRQPRILIGEDPLNLPNNFAVDTRIIPGTTPILAPSIPANTIIPNNTTIPWSNVAAGPSGNLEILFSPTGAVVGTNAGSGKILLTVYDMTMNPFDINRIGIVAVQARTGFIGAYSAGPGTPGAGGYDPFGYAASGRESGL